MAFTPTIYDTNELVAVIPNLKTAQTFLRDTFFTNIVEADSEFISIDIDVGVRRMAPFCSPLVEGRLVEQRRFQTNTFKPAYIKDKRAPDLRKPVRRMIGERIGGDNSAEVRYAMNVEMEMTDQIDNLARREEWMASQALQFGSVTISGTGFPTTLVDFGRSSTLTTVLTGTAQWTAANIVAGNASPSGNIEGWQRAILKSSGAVVTDIVLTTSPYQAFLQDPNVKGAVFYPALGMSGNLLNPGAQIVNGAVLKGHWGQYRIWMYNDWYVDVNGVDKPMLPDGSVILAGPEIAGVRGYGMIMDPSFAYGSLAYAPKMWIENDPAQLFMMMQSAPLLFPGRPNASLAATVCAAAYF
jgi:hypothetical protein